MTSKTLTKQEALLLQRHIDAELTEGEGELVEALLERSAPARVYVAALKSLHEAVRIAEKMAWKGASLPPPETWVELAEASSDLAETALDDLAPMLERFHDGEVDETEAAVVAALVDEREDVAGYLSELDRLTDGIRNVGVADEVDFDGFWEGVREGIDEIDEQSAPVSIDPFDSEEHKLLLYRYHDDEVTADERRRVDAWIESKDQQVDSFLGALAEVHLGVNVGIEVAREQADLDEIWTGVCDDLDAIDAERAADNVVAFDSPPAPSTPAAPAQPWNKPILAVAAAVLLLVTGALMGPQLLHQDEEIIETQTVVIFDNIESAPGSSVFLHSPELAGHEMEHGFGADRTGQPRIQAEDDYADPTVLWIIDDEEDSEEDDEDSEEETEELPGPI